MRSVVTRSNVEPDGQDVIVTTRVARLSLASACLGWMFDAFDLQLFTVILFPCVSELIGSTGPGRVAYTAGLVTCIKLLAWGLGGIAFGVVADRIGRTRTMIVTVLIYSAFTALSALSQTWWELAIFQALAGVGIAGEWAAGAALVAETASEDARPRAMQIMQMSFAGGFFLAALVNLVLGPIGWRWVLAVGALPALLTLFIRRFVPEPELWTRARRRSPCSAWLTFAGIFAPEVRQRTIVGVLVAATMMIGSWGATTLLPIWIHQLLPAADDASVVKATSQMFMLINVGAVLGYVLLIWMTTRLGRRWSYFLMAAGAAGAVLVMFSWITTASGLLWFIAVYGFFAIGGFGTFAAYLPELFPTRIRATGQGFCWNAARMLTAAGPLISGSLAESFRAPQDAGLAMAAIYAIGMVAIWFGPETRGKPLAS